MRLRLPFLSATLAALVLPSSGCGVDLPTCDEEMARTPAFKLEGDVVTTPAYEGQALIIRSCGNGGTCHAPAAEGSDRIGAPAGLDFDVRLATADGDPDRLRKNQRKVHDNRHAIAEQVVRGFMPPGEQGEQALGPPYLRGPTPDADPLPEIDSKEGEDILKNWLACGSPVVEEVQVPSGSLSPGDFCGPGSEEIGDCIVRVEPQPPDPTWSSIYRRVIQPQCVRCHAEGTVQFDTSGLDLSGRGLAYDQLVDREAAGVACGDMGTLVVPGDASASLLIDKLASDSPSCGEPMPIGGLLDSEFVEPIRTWIDMGAMND